jgi:3-hydroxyisobutyrate dehydrogenase-like beta-hydroxyacid dehydrogenase
MIGVIGLGAMGGNMAATFLRKMQDVVVFDINPERCERVRSQGATIAATANDLVKTCETVILSLPSSEVTTNVLETEVLPAVEATQVVIDTGTTIVEQTRRLSALFDEKGAFLVDAPVSGGSIGAADGNLFVFVGGDRSAVNRVWSILALIGGARLTYCGESGNGQIVKAVNQLAMGLVDAAFLECIAFGVASGVDVSILRNALGGSTGFRKTFADMTDRIVNGKGNDVCCKVPEYKYYMHEADLDGLQAPILRCLSEYLAGKPATHRDNMNRPYAPLWNSLTGGSDGPDHD